MKFDRFCRVSKTKSCQKQMSFKQLVMRLFHFMKLPASHQGSSSYHHQSFCLSFATSRTSFCLRFSFIAVLFRGRYSIKVYPTFLQLHGKTYDYKIPHTTCLRLFLLPHKDQRFMYFVVSIFTRQISNCKYYFVNFQCYLLKDSYFRE